MKVLFVDDEVRVLEALERVLSQRDCDWDATFLSSAEEALSYLEQEAWDVVVSDLRMPAVDGVALLAHAALLHPHSFRLVLSGQSDEEAALNLVHVAHQFLAKPCAADSLFEIIARSEQLGELLPQRELQALAAQLGALPNDPDVHQQLLELATQESTSAAELADVMRTDPGWTSKLLQVANSAFFQTQAQVADVETAVRRLGPRALRNLVRCASAPPRRASARPSVTAVQELRKRSLRLARVAAGMASSAQDAGAAYAAGLMCDVGKLVLQGSTEHHDQGAHHAALGAYLLGLWGLPERLVDAVARHHDHRRERPERLGPPELVWLAACIVDDEEPTEALARVGVERLFMEHRRRFLESPP